MNVLNDFCTTSRLIWVSRSNFWVNWIFMIFSIFNCGFGNFQCWFSRNIVFLGTIDFVFSNNNKFMPAPLAPILVYIMIFVQYYFTVSWKLWMWFSNWIYETQRINNLSEHLWSLLKSDLEEAAQQEKTYRVARMVFTETVHKELQRRCYFGDYRDDGYEAAYGDLSDEKWVP